MKNNLGERSVAEIPEGKKIRKEKIRKVWLFMLCRSFHQLIQSLKQKNKIINIKNQYSRNSTK